MTKLNLAFIERENLTLRQGSPYLNPRSSCHARTDRALEGHLELLRRHDNFCRPHGALELRAAARSPAMQADLVTMKPTFLNTLRARAVPPGFVGSLSWPHRGSRESEKRGAWHQPMGEAPRRSEN